MQDELESKIEEKEEEIEEARNGEIDNSVIDLGKDLDSLQDDLATLKAHSF
jgi:hypothetical protein